MNVIDTRHLISEDVALSQEKGTSDTSDTSDTSGASDRYQDFPPRCYRCEYSNYHTKGEYEYHCVNIHRGLPGYPGPADIKAQKLIPQGMSWEGPFRQPTQPASLTPEYLKCPKCNFQNIRPDTMEDHIRLTHVESETTTDITKRGNGDSNYYNYNYGTTPDDNIKIYPPVQKASPHAVTFLYILR